MSGVRRRLGALKVSESRKRLLGLDAPAKARIEVIPEEVVDRRIAQLEARRDELLAANGAVRPPGEDPPGLSSVRQRSIPAAVMTAGTDVREQCPLSRG